VSAVEAVDVCCLADSSADIVMDAGGGDPGGDPEGDPGVAIGSARLTSVAEGMVRCVLIKLRGYAGSKRMETDWER